MRTLKSVYPDYQDDIGFIAVDVDPSEDAEHIATYAAQQAYPWEMATYDGGILVDYAITSQASKIVIDADGIITLRGTYGTLSERAWRDALDAVTA